MVWEIAGAATSSPLAGTPGTAGNPTNTFQTSFDSTAGASVSAGCFWVGALTGIGSGGRATPSVSGGVWTVTEAQLQPGSASDMFSVLTRRFGSRGAGTRRNIHCAGSGSRLGRYRSCIQASGRARNGTRAVASGYCLGYARACSTVRSWKLNAFSATRTSLQNCVASLLLKQISNTGSPLFFAKKRLTSPG